MRAAQDAISSAPKPCTDTLKVQVKAARMQLELSKEAKDAASAQTVVGGLRELANDAKKYCPQQVASELEKAISALSGQPVDADDDDDLKAEPPRLVPDTSASKPAIAPPAKPFVTPAPALDFDREVANVAKILAKGFSPMGTTLRGYGKRSDWEINLESGKCYAFVGVGGPTTRRFALYLWDQLGKRQTDRRSKEPFAVVYHCPFVSGPFHLQAKVKRPESGYAVGVYVR
jgi:hypothetical protein